MHSSRMRTARSSSRHWGWGLWDVGVGVSTPPRAGTPPPVADPPEQAPPEKTPLPEQAPPG